MLLILLIAYMLVIRLILVSSYNLDADGAEFTFVHYIQKLLTGKQFYSNPTTYPYSTVLYTPLYLYIVFFITKLLQLDYLTNIHEIYIVGRSVSFVCVLASIYVVDLIIKKQQTNRLTRLLAVFVFLLIMSGHAFVLRPDGMKILFFLLFLHQYLNYFFYDKKIRNAVLLLLFAGLSFLSKQDVFVYILLFSFMHFLISKTKKSFLIVFMLCFLFFLVSFFLKMIFGEYTFINLFNFNLQSISNIKSSYNLLVVLFNSARFLPVLAILLFSFYKIRNENEMQLKLLIIAALFSFCMTTFFLFRPGSFLNYTYESSILLMYALFLIFNKYKYQFRLLLMIYFAVFFGSNLRIKNYRYFPSKEKKYKIEYHEFSVKKKQILPYIESHASIFTPQLQLGIFYADLNIIYGHEYHLDRHIYSLLGIHTTSKLMLNKSTQFDEEFLIGNVKYILTYDKKEVNEVVKEFYLNYKLKQKFDSTILYEFIK